jgi:hypothetical protein
MHNIVDSNRSFMNKTREFHRNSEGKIQLWRQSQLVDIDGFFVRNLMQFDVHSDAKLAKIALIATCLKQFDLAIFAMTHLIERGRFDQAHVHDFGALVT